MSEPLNKSSETTDTPIPAYVPDDMIPAWLWLKEKGLAALIMIVVGVLIVAGVSAFLRSRDQKATLASTQLLTEPTIEAMEKAATDYAGTPAGIAAKLKLAKARYDAGQYDQALASYDDFLKNHASYPFADVARVGRGYALCGLNDLPKALEVFRSFRTANPEHYLVPQTILGEAACLVAQGNKPAALELLQNLRAARRDTAWEAAARRMEGAIERYRGAANRLAPSLLDQANALAPLPGAAPVAPVAK
jgi:tetratricopeptide (TPR) repeat protein